MLGLSMYDRREIAYINRLLGPFAILGWIVYLFVHVIIPKSRVAFPWLFLLVLTACGNPFVPDGAVPFNPSADFAGLWQQMEQCSGKTGDMNRVHWFQVAKLNTPDGKFHTGWWESPHAIYLTQFDSWIVKHEMLHDLTQSPVHGAIFVACGEM